jgi:cobalamin-dependent methionine synthase I
MKWCHGKLLDLQKQLKGLKKERKIDLEWRKLQVTDRITHALVKGIPDHIEADVEEARPTFEKPLQVIEGPLNGWNECCWGALWSRENVPSPSCQISKSYEKSCCLPTAIY